MVQEAKIIPQTPQEQPDRSEPKLERLPVDLTTTELLERGRNLAELNGSIKDIEEAAKAVALSYKREIALKESEAAQIAQEISTRQQWREVDCRDDFYYEDSTVRRLRLDTGKIIGNRRMTAEERSLPFG